MSKTGAGEDGEKEGPPSRGGQRLAVWSQAQQSSSGLEVMAPFPGEPPLSSPWDTSELPHLTW